MGGVIAGQQCGVSSDLRGTMRSMCAQTRQLAKKAPQRRTRKPTTVRSQSFVFDVQIHAFWRANRDSEISTPSYGLFKRAIRPGTIVVSAL